MLTRLAWSTVRHRRIVLALSGLFLVAAGALGSGAFGVLEDGGFEDPDAESTRAADAIEGRFDAGAPNLVLLAGSSTGSVDDPGAAADGAVLTDALAEWPDVTEVESYWSLGGPPGLRSTDGDEALVLAYVSGDEDAVIEGVRGALGGPQGVLDVKVGGREAVDNEIASTVESSLERTGRIVSAAAALLAITFLAFGTADVTFLKLFGIGLALAVVMDATVIRGLLVPAVMRLAGPANWWTPAPLRRFHRRFGIGEPPEPVVAAEPTRPLVGAGDVGAREPSVADRS